MIKKLERDSNTLTIASFWENVELNKYNFNPPYQRKSIWSEEKKSFLIDSILRNFPMPPIFLRQNIDIDTGKTKYDVIDGKQRLSSIISFIKNEISVSSDFENEENETPNLSGAFFTDLDKPEFTEVKKDFWRYGIPIELIDATDSKLIDDIFDRLNRNGEPLTGQELRNAQYHGSALLDAVHRISDNPFWKPLLAEAGVSRMEDREFLSELLFTLIEGEVLESKPQLLDGYYGKYAKDEKTIAIVEAEFQRVTKIIESFDLDLSEHKITGVSHLYGLFTLAMYCYKGKINVSNFPISLRAFFDELRKGKISNPNIKLYKDTMSSRTKSKGQRQKRLEALKKYLTL